MNELIEKLKRNDKPFGLLSEEEQKCLCVELAEQALKGA